VDRTLSLCDLLMGAAYSDGQLADEEKASIRTQLAWLAGGTLPPDVDARIAAFHPWRFDVTATAAAFRDDPEEDRRKILILAAAIIDADEEINFFEDCYLRALATALALPDSALAGLTVEIEAEPEEIQRTFAAVRKGPPPPPPKSKPAV
jgi:uncharacterized membrane protein YebE (DUF533 family)